MTFQPLNDLTRLQIPQVDLVIFASANNPFPGPRYTEAGEDTVGGICMPRVCLKYARRMEVPKADGVVKSAG